MTIFLDFAQLKPTLTEKIEKLSAEIAELRNDGQIANMSDLSDKEKELEVATVMFELYHSARAVGTSLDIAPRTQALLIEAGRQAVRNNAGTFLDCLADRLER